MTSVSRWAIPFDCTSTPVLQFVIVSLVSTTGAVTPLPMKSDPAIHWYPMLAPLAVLPLYVTVVVALEWEVTRNARSRLSDGALPAASLRKLLLEMVMLLV